MHVEPKSLHKNLHALANALFIGILYGIKFSSNVEIFKTHSYAAMEDKTSKWKMMHTQ